LIQTDLLIEIVRSFINIFKIIFHQGRRATGYGQLQ